VTETPNGNGKNGKFDWRGSLFTVGAVIVTAAIQWGVLSAQISDHSRRLDLLEHQISERSVAREEYDRRHEDLIRQLEQLRKELEDVRVEQRSAQK
jgi:hypothetical protein